MSRPHDERPGRHRTGRAVPGPRPGGAQPPAERPGGRHAPRRPVDGPAARDIPAPRPEQGSGDGDQPTPAYGAGRPPAHRPRPLRRPDQDAPTTGPHPVPAPRPSHGSVRVPPASGQDTRPGTGRGAVEPPSGLFEPTDDRPHPGPSAVEPPSDLFAATGDQPGSGPNAVETSGVYAPTGDQPGSGRVPDQRPSPLFDPDAAPGRRHFGSDDDTRTGRIPAPRTRRAPVRPPVDRTFGPGIRTAAEPGPPGRDASSAPSAGVPTTVMPAATAASAPPAVVPPAPPATAAPTTSAPAHDRATIVAPPRPATARSETGPTTVGSTPTPAPPRPDRKRLLGVDVARGVALFGIIAVHALVEGNDDGSPATNYMIFGGRSAALFALLAGVALAFMTGRARVRRDSAAPVVAMVATRAAVLLVLGLALGWTDPEIAAVILPYYAVMFLLAIPLLFLPTGMLAGLTVVLAGAVPVLSHLVRPSLPVPTLDNPHVVDLVTGPLGLLSELTLTGAYPAVPWLAYLGAGIVVGRLRLSSLRTAVTLLVGGAAAAGAAAAVSWWLLTRAGGYDAIIAATPLDQLESAPTVVDFVNAVPDGVTPTTTWWWLATVAPHSGTPLDLVQTTGSALAVLGAALLLAGVTRPLPERLLGYVLRPVAAAGSMTLTLYTASLLFMNSPLDVFDALEGYLWQIGAALVIGTAWRRAVGRGPLEAATSMLSHAARDRVRAHRRVERARRPARRGARSSRSR